MQIQISWLLQKPTDLDLHYLQSQGVSGFSRTRVKLNFLTLNQFVFCVLTVLGGHDIRDLNPQWFRQKISMVSQEPTLFACSIKDNIAYGRDASIEEVSLTLSPLQTNTYTSTNIVEPNETAPNKLSHQDLYCLPFCD